MSFLKSALLEHDVQFLHSSRHILEMQGLAMVIRNRRAIPILFEGLFKNFVD